MLLPLMLILLYGQDKGQVRYRALQIINTIKSSLNSDVIKVSLEDLENNKFVDLINQKNIFSNKLIINLDLDLYPSLNLGFEFFSSIASTLLTMFY